jgi:hypothetical protein
VLLAFALGLVLGVMVMTPRWWRERQALNPAVPPTEVSAATEVQRGI